MASYRKSPTPAKVKKLQRIEENRRVFESYEQQLTRLNSAKPIKYELHKYHDEPKILLQYTVDDDVVQFIQPVEVPVIDNKINHDAFQIWKNDELAFDEYFTTSWLNDINSIKKRNQSGQTLFYIKSLSRKFMECDALCDFKATKLLFYPYFREMKIITGNAITSNSEAVDFYTLETIKCLNQKVISDHFDAINVITSGNTAIHANGDGTYTFYDTITKSESTFINVVNDKIVAK